jgi:hypothetical protein
VLCTVYIVSLCVVYSVYSLTVCRVQFLDVQHISQLTAYLQALHAAKQATEDHTTLLLNCYTKLKDISNLEAFLTKVS